MTLYRFIVSTALLSTALYALPAKAADLPCASASDRACVAAAILKDAGAIEEAQWRDQALRDVAVSLTYDGKIDDAIAQIPKISNPDTKAMTIRGIGMAAALYRKDSPDALRAMFVKLDKTAIAIENPAAAGIAQTYIAMAQAFAGLDDDAWATASRMSNASLKHKAYGETAEIQAERGDTAKAMKSITLIDAASYRNKTYLTVSDILLKAEKFDDALKCAQAIDNPAKRVLVLQKILRAQEEKTRGARNDAAAEAVSE